MTCTAKILDESLCRFLNLLPLSYLVFTFSLQVSLLRLFVTFTFYTIVEVLPILFYPSSDEEAFGKRSGQPSLLVMCCLTTGMNNEDVERFTWRTTQREC